MHGGRTPAGGGGWLHAITRRRGPIPSLDGLRAVAIALVLIDHAAGMPKPGGAWSRIYPYIIQLGIPGVALFFVLSGFLITGILLGEEESRGGISLRRFYFRRTLRIFPAFYTLVGVILLLSAFGWPHVRLDQALAPLTYTSDYVVPVLKASASHMSVSWTLDHSWSLSVEEQFYLIWPAALVLLGARRAPPIAVGTILLVPLLRVLTVLALPGTNNLQYEFFFHCRADALATGCLLACLRPALHAHVRYQKLLRSPWMWLAPVAAVLAFEAPQIGWALRPASAELWTLVFWGWVFLGWTVMNVALALCLDWCVTNHRSIAGRMLNAKPVVAIGVLSYSIYLWQNLFLAARTSCRCSVGGRSWRWSER